MTYDGQTVPSIIANGAEIPQIGLGTWKLDGEELHAAVQAAAEAGYRHFDTAPRYENEAALGQALKDSGLDRDGYFLTTKVWFTDLEPAALIASAEASLRRLGTDRVDLLLIHWPNPEIALEATIPALCEARRRGLTRHIGVSNFPPRLLEKAIALADAPLVADQCEYHPRLDQGELLGTCRKNGVAFVSYGPLGSGTLLADPVIGRIAGAKGRTPGQVILRWHLQQGVVAIPRSSNPGRIAQNIQITDFSLSDSEMTEISGLAAADGRIFNPGWVKSWN